MKKQYCQYSFFSVTQLLDKSGVCLSPQELGNNLDKCKNNENLQQILTNATIMVVSVTASTTQG